ncbi:hypothetical protein [Microbulbifer taiwanensis]|uniref:hypothetical protein n=1 Tax=Microbulbifer taiwanensis TaxID=986746 RepID=UPI003616E097
MVNLACSGAESRHLWPLVNEGEFQGDQAPQITRLEELAYDNDIELIVLGIGGNDMGFSDMITECMAKWVKKHWTADDDDRCWYGINDHLSLSLFDTYGKVSKSIDLVRQTMAVHGKTDPNDYRIVLMGYPAILAGFYDNRYGEGHRREFGRCPFIGDDAEFFEHTLMPKLNGLYETLAHEKSVDFVNPQYVLDGHKLCEVGSQRATPEIPATAANMEWVRYIDNPMDAGAGPDALITWLYNTLFGADNPMGEQGRLNESMHPNQFGQEALGSCLRKWWSQRGTAPSAFNCTNPNPASTQHVKVGPLAEPASVHVGGSYSIPDGELQQQDPPWRRRRPQRSPEQDPLRTRKALSRYRENCSATLRLQKMANLSRAAWRASNSRLITHIEATCGFSCATPVAPNI